ncbi:hypothetical protein EMGBS4_03240 [Acidimicrobiaceae bacterium]|nr:hypothetical protein EMGBS4_03240 [Acidimicrobiaceae bacterium]
MPIVGGIAGFALLFGVTWILASTSTNNRRSRPESIPQTFEIGKVTDIAKTVDEGGPILYPDLRDATGKRSIVIDHTGDNPAKGWQVYYAYPADRPETCLVEHIKQSRNFKDCEGRTLAVEELKLPLDVRPIVENLRTLLIDLRAG